MPLELYTNTFRMSFIWNGFLKILFDIDFKPNKFNRFGKIKDTVLEVNVQLIEVGA